MLMHEADGNTLAGGLGRHHLCIHTYDARQFPCNMTLVYVKCMDREGLVNATIVNGNIEVRSVGI